MNCRLVCDLENNEKVLIGEHLRRKVKIMTDCVSEHKLMPDTNLLYTENGVSTDTLTGEDDSKNREPFSVEDTPKSDAFRATLRELTTSPPDCEREECDVSACARENNHVTKREVRRRRQYESGRH